MMAEHSWVKTISLARHVTIEANGQECPMCFEEWAVRRRGPDIVWLRPQKGLFTSMGIQSATLAANMALAGHIQRLHPLGHYSEAWGNISQESHGFDRIHNITTETTVSGSPVFDREQNVVGLHRGSVNYDLGAGAKTLVNIMVPRSSLKLLLTMDKIVKEESPASNTQKGNDPDWHEPSPEELDNAKQAYAEARAAGEIAQFVNYETGKSVVAMAKRGFVGQESQLAGRSWADLEEEEKTPEMEEEEQAKFNAALERKGGINAAPQMRRSAPQFNAADVAYGADVKEESDFQTAPQIPGAVLGPSGSTQKDKKLKKSPNPGKSHSLGSKVSTPSGKTSTKSSHSAPKSSSDTQSPVKGSTTSPTVVETSPQAPGAPANSPPGESQKLSRSAKRRLQRQKRSQSLGSTGTPTEEQETNSAPSKSTSN